MRSVKFEIDKSVKINSLQLIQGTVHVIDYQSVVSSIMLLHSDDFSCKQSIDNLSPTYQGMFQHFCVVFPGTQLP